MNSFEEGLMYFTDGNLDKAESCFTQAINENRQNAEAFYNRGKVNRSKGDFTAAINDFRQVLEINPNYTEASVAIEMMKNILSFRDPNLLNP